jgi:nucleotide-binding universal stress UspA family protein
MSDYRTFVVPYDFSEHARAALDTAVDLARRLGAELHLIHIIHLHTYAHGAFGGVSVPAPTNTTEIQNALMKSLQGVVAGIDNAPAKVEPHIVEGANVAEMIRASAEELGADLIVMGTHGRTGLAHVFLGSVAERTLRKAPCPVLTVQAPGEDDR